MSKIEQFKEREIEGKLKTWKAKGIQYCELESRNVRPISYVHYNGVKIIKIEYSFGFGPGEQFIKLEFKEELLNEKLKLFTPKKVNEGELKLKFILPEKSKNLLEMSEKTTNNIKSLQTSLFNAIKKLEDKSISCEEAKAIAGLGQTIINTAKLEIEYQKLLSTTPSVSLLN